MEIILSVKNLRKVFSTRPPMVAVDDISFELKKGEILGILGANGAGKTTTIQMLLGTLAYTEGTILYFGKDFNKHRSEVLQHVAFASTYINLPAQLTLEQNLNVCGRLYGLDGPTIAERSQSLLKRFGIFHKYKAHTSSLSAGQLTRLVLVKAFLVRPALLLLDEPTASLDPDIAKEVCSFILEQREVHKTSMLFTSHKMAEVAEVCDRVLSLEKGRLLADDTPANLAKTISVSTIQFIIEDGMQRMIALAQQKNLPYSTSESSHRWIEVKIETSEISSFLITVAKAEINYSSINIYQPTLEDYFLKMVKK